MTNIDFRVFLGYLVPKFSKRNYFSQVCPSRRKTSVHLCRVGRSGPMAIIYKSYIGRVLKTVNIYVNNGINRYFKIIPQRN